MVPGFDTMHDSATPQVLVTGATGRIGRHVVNELLDRGYRVRAVTSKPVSEVIPRDRLEWCQLDFQQSLDFSLLLRDCVGVIHLAGEIHVMERMQRSNVEATRALAEASEQAGVKFFCYTSSVAVYGSSRKRQVSEDSPVLTADRDVRSEYWDAVTLRCYGRTKLGGELAIKAVANAVDYVIVRPTVVVDVPDLVRLGDWSKAQKQRGAARHAHNVYVRDVADVIAWFLAESLRNNQLSPNVRTFNFSEDDAPIATYGQLFRSAYNVTGDRRWQVAPVPWLVEWLWVILRARRLMLRQPFGRMLFSGEKLRATGYKFRFGMSRAIADFHRELVNTVDNAGQTAVGAPAAPSTQQ